MNYQILILVIYIAWLIVCSIVSFGLFKKDKKKAINGQIRIKEKVLLESVVIGGAIGGFIGRIAARHKTEKKYFSFIIYLSLLVELLVLCLLIFLIIK